ncbi:3-phosphoglycerate kinase [Pseudomonas japonica]|uniref:3-phosphoglycerate kinase n=1 Tax=Pseudomonas japonica TaxID=256466 RepID=UPI003812A7AC
MKKFCVAVLALLPLSALAAYPIEVEKAIGGGIKLDTTAYDTDYDRSTITLNNYGDVAARCGVVFRNGPETRTRSVDVPAKQSLDVTSRFTRQIIKMRIKVTCEAQQAN